MTLINQKIINIQDYSKWYQCKISCNNLKQLLQKFLRIKNQGIWLRLEEKKSMKTLHQTTKI